MLTKVRYTVKDMLKWTRIEVLYFTIYATAITVLFEIVGFTFLQIPWAPLAVVGTAVAFIIGFQNNAAYGRIWEARKIWGGVVNTSRTWGMMTKVMVGNQHASEPVSNEELKSQRETLIHRHIAWLTAFRHAMRHPKKWEENMRSKTNKEWEKEIHIPERIFSLGDDLFDLLSDKEWNYVMSKGNKATALLYLQSQHINDLKDRGLIWEFSFLQLERVLEEFFTLQGKSERIKNFPYPRQYATLSYFFVWIFIALFPIATISQMSDIGARIAEMHPFAGEYFIWVTIPFSVAVMWIFHTMERIGRIGENPFEGSPNDVPISTIARGIEIDLRQMLDEDDDLIPKQFPEVYDVQM